MRLGASLKNSGKNAGEGNIATLIVVLLVAVLGWTIYVGAGAYMDHGKLEVDAKNLVDNDLLKPDPTMKQKLLDEIKASDPEFDEKQLSLAYGAGRYSVHVIIPYKRSVDFRFATINVPMTIEFDIERSEMKQRMDNTVNSFKNAVNASQDRLNKPIDEQ